MDCGEEGLLWGEERFVVYFVDEQSRYWMRKGIDGDFFEMIFFRINKGWIVFFFLVLVLTFFFSFFFILGHPS